MNKLYYIFILGAYLNVFCINLVELKENAIPLLRNNMFYGLGVSVSFLFNLYAENIKRKEFIRGISSDTSIMKKINLQNNKTNNVANDKNVLLKSSIKLYNNGAFIKDKKEDEEGFNDKLYCYHYLNYFEYAINDDAQDDALEKVLLSSFLYSFCYVPFYYFIAKLIIDYNNFNINLPIVFISAELLTIITKVMVAENTSDVWSQIRNPSQKYISLFYLIIAGLLGYKYGNN